MDKIDHDSYKNKTSTWAKDSIQHPNSFKEDYLLNTHHPYSDLENQDYIRSKKTWNIYKSNSTNT